MKRAVLLLTLSLALAACSDSDDTSSSSAGSTSSGSSGGEATTSSSSGSTGTTAGASSSSSSGSGSTGGDGTGSSSSTGSTGADTCSAARAQLLGSVDTVSSGDVTVLDDTDGVVTLYVDASAGGIAGGASNPYTFVDLGAGTKAQVTDVTSVSSTAWDLALKRAVLYTNDGTGGPGAGGAVLLDKDFDEVTADDAAGATFGTEAFFDADCNPNTDETGSVLTTFSVPVVDAQFVFGWYTYDLSNNTLSPTPGTWLVRGATGALYKLQIVTYYANPDGTVGTGDGATYVLKVAAL